MPPAGWYSHPSRPQRTDDPGPGGTRWFDGSEHELSEVSDLCYNKASKFKNKLTRCGGDAALVRVP